MAYVSNCAQWRFMDFLTVFAAAVSCAIDKKTGALLLDPDASEEKVRSAIACLLLLANPVLSSICSILSTVCRPSDTVHANGMQTYQLLIMMCIGFTGCFGCWLLRFLCIWGAHRHWQQAGNVGSNLGLFNSWQHGHTTVPYHA